MVDFSLHAGLLMMLLQTCELRDHFLAGWDQWSPSWPGKALAIKIGQSANRQQLPRSQLFHLSEHRSGPARTRQQSKRRFLAFLVCHFYDIPLRPAPLHGPTRQRKGSQMQPNGSPAESVISKVSETRIRRRDSISPRPESRPSDGTSRDWE